MNKSKNIAWINTLRAIGIITVIIGHNDTILTKYIYSFHMALFFFLSGLTFNEIKWSNTYGFIKSRIKSLVIPYFIYAAFLYVIWIPLDLFQGKLITKDILIKNLFGIFYSQGSHKYMTWGIPMWFLTCLFVVSILYYFLNKNFKENTIFSLIICAIIGYITKFLPVRLPWSIDVAFTAVVFYGIGHLYKKRIINYRISRKTISKMILFIGISVIFSSMNGRVDFYSNKFNNYILFYISAMFGILALVLIAKMIPTNNILIFIGVNTIPILAFHIRALEVIKFAFIKLLNWNINFNSILFGGIILPIMQILLIVPVIIIINKFKYRNLKS